MSKIIEKYRALLGRTPTRNEAETLDRIAAALNLREDDAIWVMLIALEHYDYRYRLAPARIEKAVQSAFEAVRVSAKHETEAAASRAIEAMAEESARIGQKIAAQTSGRDRARWMVIMACVCFAALMTTGGMAFYVGHGNGSATTTDAAAWAVSREGRTARDMAETGLLTYLTECRGNGWRIVMDNGRRVCQPSAEAAWFLP